MSDLKDKICFRKEHHLLFSKRQQYMGQALQSIRKFIDCYVLKRRWKEQFHILFHTLSQVSSPLLCVQRLEYLLYNVMFPVSMSAQTCAS